MATLQISSLFSGGGTAKLCAEALNTFAVRRGVSPPFDFTGTCLDYERGPQLALRSIPTTRCLFSNILDIWSPPVRRRLEQPFVTFEAMFEYLRRHSSDIVDV